MQEDVARRAMTDSPDRILRHQGAYNILGQILLEMDKVLDNARAGLDLES